MFNDNNLTDDFALRLSKFIDNNCSELVEVNLLRNCFTSNGIVMIRNSVKNALRLYNRR